MRGLLVNAWCLIKCRGTACRPAGRCGRQAQRSLLPEARAPRAPPPSTVDSIAQFEGGAMGKELTAKGRATRDRIVEGAALVLRERGIEQATLDEVMARTPTNWTIESTELRGGARGARASGRRERCA